jgi:hypothetical protein
MFIIFIFLSSFSSDDVTDLQKFISAPEDLASIRHITSSFCTLYKSVAWCSWIASAWLYLS